MLLQLFSFLEILLLLNCTTKCHQILCPYLTLSIFFSSPFPVPYIHICGWVVQCSSVMMKDDICDKSTDHKLSNHSRNCLLAAPLVTLSTLPHVCITPLERHHGPVQRCWVGRTWSAFTLMGIKVSHIVAKGVTSQRYPPLNISSPLSLQRCWTRNLFLRILTHVNRRRQEKKFICIIKT